MFDSLWYNAKNVHELSPADDDDKKALERELFSHELIPQQPTYLSFWEKFFELQVKMLLTNQENVQNHNYASEPTEWPFLTRGIAYFISKQSNVGAVWYKLQQPLLIHVRDVAGPGASHG